MSNSSRFIRTLTRQVKALRGLARIDRKMPEGQPDKACIRYWTQSPAVEETRRR